MPLLLQVYILEHGAVLPTCQETVGLDSPCRGFFASAGMSRMQDPSQLLKILERYYHVKHAAPVLVAGTIIGTHVRVPTGGTWQEQKEVTRSKITHPPSDQRWCIHFAYAQIADL